MKRIFLTSIIVALLLGFGAITAMAAEFSDWSPPVNLGSVVNSSYLESCVAISKNGLSLFFSSNRQRLNPTSQDRDLYVSQRESINDPWKSPMPLTELNTLVWDSCPALSLDEHRLYFTSTRPGGCGDRDLWMSQRHDRRDDQGWEQPIHLGCEWDGGVNTQYNDQTPSFFEDETGRVLMYFSRGTATGATFIYQSEMRDDGTFGPATQVEELNEFNIGRDVGPTVRRDGLEIIFLSNRNNPGGPFDFWRATRESTSDPWSEAVLLPVPINPGLAQGRIALSFDGRELYFSSNRSGGYGNYDLYVATREKLPEKKDK